MNTDSPLLAELARRLQLPLAKVRIMPLQGGDISRAWRLDSPRQSFFVKTNQIELRSMFEAEQLGLETIEKTGSLRVPRVLFTGVHGDSAFLVLEFIDLRPRVDATLLAKSLAGMHRHFNDQFGFCCDNTIGSTAQVNGFDADWIRFWRTRRLNVQLDLLAKTSASTSLIDDGYRLSAALAQFFDRYRPRPSLLHGDLWQGNQAADRHGNPVVFDPACYYGDHEADLAMMELFGNPGPRFFAVYHEYFAIDQDYPIRRELYNLYHILNHVNLFGAAYIAQATATIQRLLVQL